MAPDERQRRVRGLVEKVVVDEMGAWLVLAGGKSTPHGLLVWEAKHSAAPVMGSSVDALEEPVAEGAVAR